MCGRRLNGHHSYGNIRYSYVVRTQQIKIENPFKHSKGFTDNRYRNQFDILKKIPSKKKARCFSSSVFEDKIITISRKNQYRELYCREHFIGKVILQNLIATYLHIFWLFAHFEAKINFFFQKVGKKNSMFENTLFV